MKKEAKEVPITEVHPSIITSLKERILAGETVHEIIGSILRSDADKMFKFHEQHLLSTAGGITPIPFKPVIDAMYTSISDSAGNLDYISGFSYVASHIYPTLEKASKPPKTTQLEITPMAQAILDRSEDHGESILKRLRIDVAMIDFKVEEARKTLKANPSGESWLGLEIQSKFFTSELGGEINGALDAASGAKKLFNILTATK